MRIEGYVMGLPSMGEVMVYDTNVECFLSRDGSVTEASMARRVVRHHSEIDNE